MGTPNVSVILPTKNRTDLLPMSAGSVLAQSYRDLELIVVDDGSEENVAVAVDRLNDPRARYVRRETSGGPAAARNTGVRHATGRYLAFQDSDDEWFPGKLELQVEAIERFSGSMSICGLLRQFRAHVRFYRPPANGDGGPPTFVQIARKPRAYTQTWLVPRAAVAELNGFDEQLRIWDDWELLLRLAKKLAILPLEEPLVFSTQLSDSISTDAERFRHDLEIIVDKHADGLDAHPGALANLLHVLARLSITCGDSAIARRALMRSVRVRPTAAKSWLLLFVASFGSSAAKRLLTAHRLLAAGGGIG